jgi:hypothetical protein
VAKADINAVAMRLGNYHEPRPGRGSRSNFFDFSIAARAFKNCGDKELGPPKRDDDQSDNAQAKSDGEEHDKECHYQNLIALGLQTRKWSPLGAKSGHWLVN